MQFHRPIAYDPKHRYTRREMMELIKPHRELLSVPENLSRGAGFLACSTEQLSQVLIIPPSECHCEPPLGGEPAFHFLEDYAKGSLFSTKAHNRSRADCQLFCALRRSLSVKLSWE